MNDMVEFSYKFELTIPRWRVNAVIFALDNYCQDAGLEYELDELGGMIRKTFVVDVHWSVSESDSYEI